MDEPIKKNRPTSQYRNGDLVDSMRWTKRDDWNPENLRYPDWKKKIAIDCSPSICTSLNAVLDLIDATEHIIVNDIPGDFVEAGVYMGGSCMVIAGVLKHYDSDRAIWMYDTYQGVPEPDKKDIDHANIPLLDWYRKNKVSEKGSLWCYCHLKTVKENMKLTGYTGPINYVYGLVEDTIPETVPNIISLLRIDVDLHLPTRHVLEHLYPKVTENGHIIFDDYGFFPQIKHTVDDYFSGTKKFFHRIDRTVVHIIKLRQEIIKTKKL